MSLNRGYTSAFCPAVSRSGDIGIGNCVDESRGDSLVFREKDPSSFRSTKIYQGVVVDTDLKANSGYSLVQLATTAADAMHDVLMARYRDLAIISSLPFVRDTNCPVDTLERLLNTTKHTYEYYSWLGIALNNGIVKAAADGVLQGVNVSARPWFIACKNKPYGSPPYIGDVHSAALLQSALNLSEPLRLLDVALPLYDASNVQYGILAAHVNATMTEQISQNVLGELNARIQMDLFIVGGSDTIQAPAAESNINSIQNYTGSALELARANDTGYRVEKWRTGIKYLTAYTFSSTDADISLGFSILVRQPLSVAYATANRLIIILVLVHIGFALILAGGSYSVAHLTTAPLVAIARAADNIRKRSAMPCIPVLDGDDEIALLSRSLSSLVSALVEKEINLKGINQDLADKVEAVERAETELRASEESFRQLADTTESAFFIVDFDFTEDDDADGDRENMTAHNESWTHTFAAFTALFGVSAAELVDNPTAWLDVVDPANLGEVQKEFSARRKRPLDVTFRIFPGSRARLTKPRHINLRSLPVMSSSLAGRVKRIIGVFADVSRQAEAEIQSLNKSSWVRQVGHEIRNPLSATFTMINLLLEMPLTEEQLDLLHTIRMSNDTLLSLINSILDLAKLEAGEMTLECIPFNLATQVEDVLDLMAPQAHVKGLRIGYFIDPAVEQSVKGDPLRLRQILINLFTNALKFTKTGSVHLHVSLDSAQDICHEEEGIRKVGLRFSLVDTGIGISIANQAKLFKEFAQAEGSTSRQYGGTGLGLSIVKRLVQMMEGDVGIDSEIGKGSTFFLTVVFVAQTIAELASQPPQNLPHIGPKRILSISSWNKTQEMVEAAVRSMGGISTSAMTITAAMNAARSSTPPFDLAVIDMDVVGDPEVAKAFEELQGMMAVAVVVSREKRDTIRAKLVPGKVGAITDPIKMRKLQNEISTLLSTEPPDRVGRSWSMRKVINSDPMEKINGEVIKVMLVEDNLINQKATGRLLNKITTVPPLIAGDGQICLDMLAAMKRDGCPLPDIIFMDVSMPNLDGLSATRIIHKTYKAMQRPIIIIMTANAMHEDYMQCMQSGAEGYLLKPASREVLK
ncbi:hypothetical protein HKX48_003757 [Thoreauomyces humboldtii]|nr:hypothetical protein HKX48_003757 [Thoreauomyces humboldtii]